MTDSKRERERERESSARSLTLSFDARREPIEHLLKLVCLKELASDPMSGEDWDALKNIILEVR
mgnify:CR=1 FL=1